MRSLLFLCLLCLSTWMQAQHRRGARPAPSPELRAALKEHRNTKMRPVLEQALRRVESQLSASELQQLQALRTEHQQLRQERKTLRKRVAEQHPQGGRLSAELATAYDALHQKQQALQQKMQAFIERNEAVVKPAMEQLRPQHEQWREERHAIHQQYAPSDRPAKPHKPHKHQGGKGKHGKGKHAAARFLLMELPDEEQATDEALPFGNILRPDVSKVLGEASLFPNPATDRITLRLKITQKTDKVYARIYNSEAILVSEQVLQTLSEGSHQFEFPISHLSTGGYVLQIVEGSKTMQVLQFVKQ